MSFLDEIDAVEVSGETPQRFNTFEVEPTAKSFLDEIDEIEIEPRFEEPKPVRAPVLIQAQEIPSGVTRAERATLTPQRGIEARMAQDAEQTYASTGRKGIIAQLQSDIDNDIAVDPTLLAEYQGDLKLPEMQQVKTKPTVAPKSVEPEKEYPLWSMKNFKTGVEELKPLLGYAPEQALALGTQALDFFPGLFRGAKEAARSAWTFAIGEEKTSQIEQLAYKVPVLGKIIKSGEAFLEASGKLKTDARDLLMKEAIEQGGLPGATAATLVETVEGTLMTLKSMKALGIAYGGQAGIKSTLGGAAVRSALMAVTSEGLTPKERLVSLGLGFAYQATPALSGTIGKWTKSELIAKVTDVAANFAISAPQLAGMVDAGYARAAAEGKPNMGGFYFMLNAVQTLGSDVVFGLMTQAFKADGKIGAMREIAKVAEKTGVKFAEPPTKGFKTPEELAKPLRVDLPKEMIPKEVPSAAKVDVAPKPAAPTVKPAAEQAKVTKAAKGKKVKTLTLKEQRREFRQATVDMTARKKAALGEIEDSIPAVQSVLEDGGITPSKYLVGTGKVQTGPRKGYRILRPDLQEEYQGIDEIFQHKKGEKGGQSLDEAASKLGVTAEELKLKLSNAALEYKRIYEGKRGEPTGEGLEAEYKFKAEEDARWDAVDKRLQKTGEELSSDNPALKVGTEFTREGEVFRVVEEGDTGLIVKDGKQLFIPYETPSAKTERFFIDEGSLKNPSMEDTLTKDAFNLIGDKAVSDAELARRDAAEVKRIESEKTRVLEEQAQELPGVAKPSEPAAQVKGPGVEGGPGAAAAKGEGEFFQGVSIKNAYTDAMRESMGFPKADKVAAQSWETAKTKAQSNIDANPYHEIDLVKELAAKPRAINDVEDFHLTHATLEAERMYNKSASEAIRLEKSGNDQAIRENSIRMNAARDKIQEIYDIDKKVGTETGRGLNARKALVAEDFSLIRMETHKRAANGGKPLTPEQIAEVQRMFKAINNNPKDEGLKKKWRNDLDRDKRDPERWADAVDSYLKENKTKLPQGVSDQLKSEMKNAVRLPDENARNTAILKVIDKINGYVPTKAGDWFDAYVYTNMLSGPMSHARNILGNLTNQLALRPLTLLASKDFRGAGTYLKKSWETVADGTAWDAAMEAFRSGETSKLVESIRQLPEGATPIEKMKRQMEMAKRAKGPKNVFAKAAWKTLNWTGSFLNAQDKYFGRMIEAGEKARLIQAGKSFEFSDKQAKDLSNHYLYRDRLANPDRSLDMASRVLEHIGLTLDQVRKIPYLGRGAKLSIPFLKTPVKIAQFNTQVSALGFIGANKNRIAKAHYKMSYEEMGKQLQQEQAKKEPNQDKVRDLQENIEEVDFTSAERKGKAAVGTMLSVMGVLAAGTGNTIWAAPTDDKAKKLFYDAGYRPYSFRVPGTKKWIPMMYLGAGMLAFAIPAAIRDVLVDNPETSEADLVTKMAKLATAIPAMFLDQLPLEGLSSMMNTIQGRADYSARKVIGRTAMQVVPASGLLQWIKNMTDPTYRKAVTVKETIEAGIPGLSGYVKSLQTSEGLDAKMDIWDALLPYKVGKEEKKYIPDYKDRLQILREKMQMKRELNNEK